MTDGEPAAPRVRFGLDGMPEEEALALLEARRAVWSTAARRAEVAGYALRLPLEQREEDEEVFEAWRRMAREWNVAEPPPLASPRPWIGPLLVRSKRLLRRLTAFEIEPRFERQARFNRAVLDAFRLLLIEIQRLRTRVRELEAAARDGRARSGDGP